MKKTALSLALAVLSLGLLGSCTKINDQIDDLDKRVGVIENDKMATIAKQIEAINTSINDLEAIRANIQALMESGAAQGDDIAALKEADEILDGRIADLKVYVNSELQNYAQTEWVEATYATLAQYQATNYALTDLKEVVGVLSTELSQSIMALKNTIMDMKKTLEETIAALTGRVDTLEKTIQSVIFVPEYNDGNAYYSYRDTTLLHMNFMIRPAEVAKTLKPEDLKLLLTTVKTKSDYIDGSFEVSEVLATDAENGIYSITVPLSYDAIAYIEQGRIAACLEVKKDGTDICSEFVNVVASELPEIETLTKTLEAQYFSAQGWNGEGTIRLYYGCYPGMDSSKYLTGWINTLTGNYNADSTSMYDYRPWVMYYNAILEANLILNHVENVPAADDAQNDFLKAQALTFRAYCFFQLSQLYCKRWKDSKGGSSRGIILRTKDLGVAGNYNKQTLDVTFMGMFGDKADHPASTLLETYEQIYQDLDEAIDIFSNCGVERDADKTYQPNLDVANAIYAHAAISREDWATAAEHAIAARENHPIMSNEEYKAGFSEANDEWIWSTRGDMEEDNLHFYSYFAYVASNAKASQVKSYPLLISKELIEQIPETDIRRSLYLIPLPGETYNTTSGKANNALQVRAKTDFAYGFTANYNNTIFAYMQFKYRLTDDSKQPGIGQLCLFRAADMYYIEAEAKYQMGDEARARQILEQLTCPRDPAYSCTKTGAALLDEIKLYRRFDCWGEGFDWFDCKRWGGDYERKSYDDGGNFFTNISGVFKSTDHNSWTWVYPDVETFQNPSVTTTE